jgi:NTE family protein
MTSSPTSPSGLRKNGVAPAAGGPARRSRPEPTAKKSKANVLNGAPTSRPGNYNKRVALVLQGGGALGSYQAGVYETLAGAGYVPDWIAGISIGSINAAIIAGNPERNRVERLCEFWEGITAPSAYWPATGQTGTHRESFGRASAISAAMFGLPGFFRPSISLSWFGAVAQTSYYDTRPLKATLERLVDFDRINAGETRLSVGAVNVRTGNFCYFDSEHMKIRPEHVMASSALPPAFPAVEVDGELYWDGGLVSNTPLQYVINHYHRVSRLVFQVDLFPSQGPLPGTMEEVAEREKEIRYSSRTRMGTDSVHAMHDIRHNLESLLRKLPDDLKDGAEVAFLREIACVTTMDIAQLIYRPEQVQGSFKDYEFSRSTMRARWLAGTRDTEQTLKASPWVEPIPADVGARTFDVVRQSTRGASRAPD